jgi:hypothetical protein
VTVAAATLNRQLRAGHRHALALEPQLAAIYAKQIRALSRVAADRFTARASVQLVAAGESGEGNPDWVPPDVDEILNRKDFDAKAELAARKLHQRAIELATPPAVVAAVPAISFDVESPFAAPLLEQVGTKGVNLGLAARDVIVKVIAESYSAGLSVPDAAAALQQEIAHLSDTTALMQARTDLNGLANGASLQAVAALGSDGPPSKTWLATDDERTRETHSDADGQEVPIDQPFQVGDDELMYPGDPEGSDGEVINCRCTLIYSDGATQEEGDEMTASATATDERLATSGCSTCGHPFSEHLGSDGPCTMESCSCNGWQKMSTEIGVLAAAAGEPIPWRAILIVEGEETADGRYIEFGAIDWRELPLTLMGMIETDEGHDGAQVSGRIDSIYRDAGLLDGGRVAIVGEGVFDTGDWGTEIARLVAEKFLRGVSADLGNVVIELRPRPIQIQIGGDQFDDGYDDGPSEAIDDPDDYLVVYVKGTLLGATVCPFPAIGSGAIEIADAVTADAGGDAVARVTLAGWELAAETETLTAAAAGAVPVAPPSEWFGDPGLDGPTPMTITDDGRVFGHVAPWNVCHIGNPQGPNVCTTAPRDQSGYAYFHLGELETAEGELISVGQLTFETDHAQLALTPQQAQRHYADTGLVAAHLRCGEDQFGIWAAGALAEQLPVTEIRKLRASKMSGDWRRINGRVEMIGVLAVNIPGFPIVRPAASVRASADGWVVDSMIAAGVAPAPLTDEQHHAKVAALAARTLGREELIRLALGDEWDPLEALERRETDEPRTGWLDRGRAGEAVVAAVEPGDAVLFDPPSVNGQLDQEIALQVAYLATHGHYSDEALAGITIDRAMLREAQRLASFLVTEPSSIQSRAIQSRLVDKGLLV